MLSGARVLLFVRVYRIWGKRVCDRASEGFSYRGLILQELYANKVKSQDLLVLSRERGMGYRKCYSDSKVTV